MKYLKLFEKTQWDKYVEPEKSTTLDEYLGKNIPVIYDDFLNTSDGVGDWHSININIRRIVGKIAVEDFYRALGDYFIQKIEEDPSIYYNNKELIRWLEFDKELPDWIRRGDKAGLMDIKQK